MEFFEVLAKRHCCRKFNPDKEVSDELVEKIIKAGEMAPSAGGFFPTRISISKSSAEKTKILDCIPERMHWAKDAPVILVIWTDPKESIDYFGQRAKNLYIIQDGAIVGENIFLATTALGLSTCWVGTFEDEKLAKVLNLQGDQRPFIIMPIGYKSK